MISTLSRRTEEGRRSWKCCYHLYRAGLQSAWATAAECAASLRSLDEEHSSSPFQSAHSLPVTAALVFSPSPPPLLFSSLLTSLLLCTPLSSRPRPQPCSLCARPALLFPFPPSNPPTTPTHTPHHSLQDCAETEVDRNKCCTLCNMFFTSAIVAQSHYQGKTHAKRVRLVLGEPPSIPAAMTSPTNAGTPRPTPLPTPPSGSHFTPAAADPALNSAAFKV